MISNNYSLILIDCRFIKDHRIPRMIVSDQNVNQTTVGLNRKNYKVVDVVTGKASNTYISGIGGMSKKALMESAKLKMYNTDYLIEKISCLREYDYRKPRFNVSAFLF